MIAGASARGRNHRVSNLCFHVITAQFGIGTNLTKYSPGRNWMVCMGCGTYGTTVVPSKKEIVYCCIQGSRNVQRRERERGM